MSKLTFFECLISATNICIVQLIFLVQHPVFHISLQNFPIKISSCSKVQCHHCHSPSIRLSQAGFIVLMYTFSLPWSRGWYLTKFNNKSGQRSLLNFHTKKKSRRRNAGTEIAEERRLFAAFRNRQTSRKKLSFDVSPSPCNVEASVAGNTGCGKSTRMVIDEREEAVPLGDVFKRNIRTTYDEVGHDKVRVVESLLDWLTPILNRQRLPCNSAGSNDYSMPQLPGVGQDLGS